MNAEVDATPTSRRPATREDRATTAFLLLATFVAVIWLIVAVGARPVLPVVFLLTMFEPLILLAICVAAAWGLSRRQPWAVASCTPMLVILLVAGVVSFVVALLQARIEIPLGAALAWWALRAAPEPRAEPQRAGAAGALLIGGLMLASILPVLRPIALSPGGLLVTGEEDLNASLIVTCEPSYPDRPETIAVTYHWSWNRSEPLASGTDQATITWVAQDQTVIPGFITDPGEIQAAGVSEANRLIGEEQGVVFAIDLGVRGFAPGDIHLTLRRDPGGAAGHGRVDFRAHYIHRPDDIYEPTSNGLWFVNEIAHCEW